MKKMREPKSVFVKGFDDPEYIRIIANFKRFLEKWSLDADFREVYEQNSEKAIADSGLDVEPEAIKLMLDEEKARNLQKALTEKSLTWKDLPESYVLYRAFIQEKLSFREKLRIDLCAPTDSLFNAWPVLRCSCQRTLRHIPLQRGTCTALAGRPQPPASADR